MMVARFSCLLLAVATCGSGGWGFAPSVNLQSNCRINKHVTTTTSPFQVSTKPAALRPSSSPLEQRFQERSSTACSLVIDPLIEALDTMPPDFDLAFGMFVIFMAVTPYAIGLFFPRFLFKNFFLPVYGDNDEAGRRAEIYWKLMYATLGLALTAVGFTETILEDFDAFRALRDSYVVWALFYIAAIIKIRYEADKEIIQENRLGIQLWHSFVVIALLIDVGLRPGILDLF